MTVDRRQERTPPFPMPWRFGVPHTGRSRHIPKVLVVAAAAIAFSAVSQQAVATLAASTVSLVSLFAGLLVLTGGAAFGDDQHRSTIGNLVVGLLTFGCVAVLTAVGVAAQYYAELKSWWASNGPAGGDGDYAVTAASLAAAGLICFILSEAAEETTLLGWAPVTFYRLFRIQRTAVIVLLSAALNYAVPAVNAPDGLNALVQVAAPLAIMWWTSFRPYKSWVPRCAVVANATYDAGREAGLRRISYDASGTLNLDKAWHRGKGAYAQQLAQSRPVGAALIYATVIVMTIATGILAALFWGVLLLSPWTHPTALQSPGNVRQFLVLLLLTTGGAGWIWQQRPPRSAMVSVPP